EPAAELVAYIYPSSQQNDEEFLRASMMANFREAQAVYKPKDRKDYDPILVFGLETFVEMMQAEEARAEQSQIAQAICKEKEIQFPLRDGKDDLVVHQHPLEVSVAVVFSGLMMLIVTHGCQALQHRHNILL